MLYRFAEAKGYESVQLSTFLEKRSTIATRYRNPQGPLEVCPSSSGVRRSAPVWCAGHAHIS